MPLFATLILLCKATTADEFNRRNRQLMFALLTLLSYTSFRPDPPVVLVQPAGSIKIEPGNTTLADVANELTKDTKILILKTDFPLRRNTTLEGAALDNAYVFLNSSVILEKVNSTYTDCKSISDPKDVTDVTCGIVENVSAENFTDFWSLTGRVIVASEIEPVLKYGLANPFTPNVWNCFFYFLLMIVLVCWAMSHYATIDVQTRFAKKNN